MRSVIAGFSFDLVKHEVEAAMRGVKPEPAEGQVVAIGRHTYPVKQVGQIITKQDRRDFTAKEVTTVLTRLGFSCHTVTPEALAGEFDVLGPA